MSELWRKDVEHTAQCDSEPKCEQPKEVVCDPCHIPPPPPVCDGDVNSNSNSNWNTNSNANCNTNSNANCNTNVNVNETSVSVCVDVKVDVCASSAPDIDLSNLNLNGFGNVIIPDNSSQVINAGGEYDPSAAASNIVQFNLDQVNNLVDNDTSSATASNSFGNIGNLTGSPVSGTGTAASITSSEVDQALDHVGSASIDGITQSITQGANIQMNTQTFTGLDSVVADHGSNAHHDSV